MYAVYHYHHKKHRSWNPLGKEKFNVLIKCFVQGQKKITEIKMESKEPATLHQCCRQVEKLKQAYGSDLQQIFIWDLDEINEAKRRHDEGVVLQ